MGTHFQKRCLAVHQPIWRIFSLLKKSKMILSWFLSEIFWPSKQPIFYTKNNRLMIFDENLSWLTNFYVLKMTRSKNYCRKSEPCFYLNHPVSFYCKIRAIFFLVMIGNAKTPLSCDNWLLSSNSICINQLNALETLQTKNLKVSKTT